MKRLHFVTTDLEIGGTPRVVRDLAVRLREFGFDTAVTCLRPWGPVADEIAAAGVSVSAVGVTRAAQLPSAVSAVRRATANADVIFSLLVHANIVTALANVGRAMPLVQSIQTTQPRPAWHWWAQAAASRSAAKIVVPSPSTADIAIERSGVAQGDIIVIPNAVDRPDALTSRRRNEWPFRVGFLGRLDRVKRVPDLIASIARLPDVRLEIYGEGPERNVITSAIAKFGISDRVTLHGTYISPAAVLEKIDLLVLPSEAEGFGLVLIEAMAAGVPVIGSDVPGIRDVIQHGINGLLVPLDDPPRLAVAIERVQCDTWLRSTLITGGRNAVADRYAWSAVLGRYAALLHGV